MFTTWLAVALMVLGGLFLGHGVPHAARLLRRPFHPDAALWFAYAARGLVLGTGVLLLGVGMLTQAPGLSTFAVCFVAEEAYECVMIMALVRWSRARARLQSPAQ